jgi:hypothetical protein
MWVSALTFRAGSTVDTEIFLRRIASKVGQETNCRLNSLVYAAAVAGERISLWFFQTADYKALERALRLALRPAWNRV